MIFLFKKLLIFLLVASFAISSSSVVWAQTEKGARKLSLRLERLIKELDLIQEEQEKILKHQDETIETIKNVKIWARR